MVKINIKKHPYLPFGLAFCATIVIFGGLIAVSMLLVNRQMVETDLPQSEVERQAYQPSESDSQNILLIGCPNRNESAELFVLLRFDALSNRCFVVAVPSETQATVNVKTMSVAGHYNYGSSQYAVKAVENIFLIRIHHFIRMDQSAVQKIVDFFGGMEFDMPYLVQGESHQIEEGNQLLDGVRVAEVVLQGDPELNAQLVTKFIERNFVARHWNKKDSLINIIFNDCDTDYTSVEFVNLTEPFKLFFERQQDKVETIVLDGEYYEDGMEFTPTEESIVQVRSVFS